MPSNTVDFHIGSEGSRGGTRYANFADTSPTWGSAIARLGNAYVKAHAKRKTAEADRQHKSEQTHEAPRMGAGPFRRSNPSRYCRERFVHFG